MVKMTTLFFQIYFIPKRYCNGIFYSFSIYFACDYFIFGVGAGS